MANRQLYYELPHMLPKWCAAHAYRTAHDWLDTFQLRPRQALTAGVQEQGESNANDDDDDDDDNNTNSDNNSDNSHVCNAHASSVMSIATTSTSQNQTASGGRGEDEARGTSGDHNDHEAADAAGQSSNAVDAPPSLANDFDPGWLQERFFVHSHLGVVWGCECYYTKQVAAKAAQGGPARTRQTHTSGVAAADADERAQTQEARAAPHTADLTDDAGVATDEGAVNDPRDISSKGQWHSEQPAARKEAGQEREKHNDVEQGEPVEAEEEEESNAHKQRESGARCELAQQFTACVMVEFHTLEAALAWADAETPPPPPPAAVTLLVGLSSEEDAGTLTRLREAWPETPLNRCELDIQGPLEELRLGPAGWTVSVNGFAVVPQVLLCRESPLHKLCLLEYVVDSPQTSFEGELQGVQRAKLVCPRWRRSDLKSVSGLAMVPEVELVHFHGLRSLAPLQHAEEVVLKDTHVPSLEDLCDVKRLHLIRCSVSSSEDCVTLNATWLALESVSDVTSLKLPAVRHLHLRDVGDLHTLALDEEGPTLKSFTILGCPKVLHSLALGRVERVRIKASQLMAVASPVPVQLRNLELVLEGDADLLDLPHVASCPGRNVTLAVVSGSIFRDASVFSALCAWMCSLGQRLTRLDIETPSLLLHELDVGSLRQLRHLSIRSLHCPLHVVGLGALHGLGTLCLEGVHLNDGMVAAKRMTLHRCAGRATLSASELCKVSRPREWQPDTAAQFVIQDTGFLNVSRFVGAIASTLNVGRCKVFDGDLTDLRPFLGVQQLWMDLCDVSIDNVAAVAYFRHFCLRSCTVNIGGGQGRRRQATDVDLALIDVGADGFRRALHSL